MAKTCIVTKRSSTTAGKYANRTRATIFTPTGKTRRYINIQKKRIYVPELKKTVTVQISTRGLRTLNKNGVYATLKKAGAVK
ncbi:50S ribosomal protein L28 [Candidatus Nomurabacteria bacterium]|jgi:large subunit ribosomal protein L28|nr:MAG: 50S ribosomal protein L28 [Candidatus Nomurabacteria bacterium]